MQSAPIQNSSPSYRNLLKKELLERIAKNPAYSLRAFAKALGIAPSTLAEVLKGKKNLSYDLAFSVADRLGWKGQEKEYFCTLAQFETAKKPDLRATLASRLRDLAPAEAPYDLDLEAFHAISDWYHLPLLQVTRLPQFDGTARSAALLLGISELDASNALERLERLGLLKKDASGFPRRTQIGMRISSDLKNEALRKFYTQMLNKTVESFEAFTPQERISGSETFALGEADLAEANRLTEEYLNAMSALTDRSKKLSKVYHLEVHFFPVTRPVKNSAPQKNRPSSKSPKEKSHETQLA